MEELARGRPVVLPTDTVYGIGARLDVAGGIAAIFRAKGRPPEKPLPILGASAFDLEAVARFEDAAQTLAESFWPGGLTIVLPRAPGFDVDLGGAERATVAVRVPAHALARALLERTGPLAVTSANLSGRPAAATVDDARAALGDAVAVYLDGGRCAGTESTVVSLVDRVEVLRVGAVPEADVMRALGREQPPS